MLILIILLLFQRLSTGKMLKTSAIKDNMILNRTISRTGNRFTVLM